VRTEEVRRVFLAADDPLAVAATAAVQSGDLDELRDLLRAHPELVTARIGNQGPSGMSRTLLHAATDWPGRFPNNVATVRELIAAGADVNARFSGPHTETPLHWAASSDDVDVLDALLDAGADIEASGSVLGGGSPLSDAVGFGQWNAARRLIARGAMAQLWEAAALGLLDRVERFFASADKPNAEAVTEAFWSACHGGQGETAEFLLERGADLNWELDWLRRAHTDRCGAARARGRIGGVARRARRAFDRRGSVARGIDLTTSGLGVSTC
jgi:hypothetical protein